MKSLLFVAMTSAVIPGLTLSPAIAQGGPSGKNWPTSGQYTAPANQATTNPHDHEVDGYPGPNPGGGGDGTYPSKIHP
jgi:hypothetical protein